MTIATRTLTELSRSSLEMALWYSVPENFLLESQNPRLARAVDRFYSMVYQILWAKLKKRPRHSKDNREVIVQEVQKTVYISLCTGQYPIIVGKLLDFLIRRVTHDVCGHHQNDPITGVPDYDSIGSKSVVMFNEVEYSLDELQTTLDMVLQELDPADSLQRFSPPRAKIFRVWAAYVVKTGNVSSFHTLHPDLFSDPLDEDASRAAMRELFVDVYQALRLKDSAFPTIAEVQQSRSVGKKKLTGPNVAARYQLRDLVLVLHEFGNGWGRDFDGRPENQDPEPTIEEPEAGLPLESDSDSVRQDHQSAFDFIALVEGDSELMQMVECYQQGNSRLEVACRMAGISEPENHGQQVEEAMSRLRCNLDKLGFLVLDRLKCR